MSQLKNNLLQLTILHTEKEYVAFFAEGEGFHRIHMHVIPKHKGLPAELKGPKIFRPYPKITSMIFHKLYTAQGVVSLNSHRYYLGTTP